MVPVPGEIDRLRGLRSELARSVYRLNDRRAELKRELNTRLGSGLVEEKLYIEY